VQLIIAKAKTTISLLPATIIGGIASLTKKLVPKIILGYLNKKYFALEM